MTDKLIQGFEEFYSKEGGERAALIPKLVDEGQSPRYFMISCIDSRANPGVIFNPLPGTFFSFKSMGAIVRPYKKGTALSASLQYAFEYMNVPKLVLLGHTQCGAIHALEQDIDDPEIASFIDVAKTGLKKAQDKVGKTDQNELLREAEKQIILQSMENIKGYPAVAKAIAENRLDIHGWIFDMKAGNLLEYNSTEKAFIPITSIEETMTEKRDPHA